MEPLWRPVVANGGNRRQIEESRKPQKQAKTVAVGCDPLPETFHGKGGGRRFESVRGLCKAAGAQELARAGLTSEAKAEYIKLLKSTPQPRCARIGARKLAKREFETAGALLHAGYRAEAFKKVQDGLQLSATRSPDVPAELRR